LEQSEHTGGSIPHLPDWDWFLDCLRQEGDAAAKQDAAAEPFHEAGAPDWIAYM
jgi:hypothetical protein